MKSQATHAKASTWTFTTIQLEKPVVMTEKAVQLVGDIVKGSVWFPLSCVNVVDQFEVQVPTWMLKTKGLNFLA